MAAFLAVVSLLPSPGLGAREESLKMKWTGSPGIFVLRLGRELKLETKLLQCGVKNGSFQRFTGTIVPGD